MLFLQGIAWIFDGANWASVNSGLGIGGEILAHLFLSVICILIAIVIAVPIGLYIGHTGRGRGLAIVVANVVRAFPTLGLLSILLLLFGLGLPPTVFVFVLLGLPPLLAGAYAGLESIDRQTIDAARAMGMTEWQILARVEVPLAAPLLVGGLRSGALQIIATVTLVSNFGTDSLGAFVISGIASQNYVEMVGGAVLVTVLALAVDGLLVLVQRTVVPRGVSRGTDSTTTARGRQLPTAPTATPS
ncbi:ABC transporter permease [uncultured Amnibacterium sp.]|uniref:ABC transporter permease n=1 Tax=uncultured Amnibacterium sp. TaxID=1631851 RepID=UPI0035CC2171